MTTTSARDPSTEVLYPESDGKPVAETDVHIDQLLFTRATLRDYFRDRPDVYVAGNLLLYYEEGNPKSCVAPDVFVVFGVAKHQRRTYKLWEERRPPAVVIEITSRATQRQDLHTKRTLYARLGVGEYFLFDPLAEYLQPPLQGYRLVEGQYVPLAAEADGSLLSEALGLRLRRDEQRLRLIAVATGESLLHPDEIAAARRTAEERAAVAEAELARLRAELARLRGEASSEST